MADVIGTVGELNGTFYARDEAGELRELQSGDEVYAGETIVPDTLNAVTDTVSIIPNNGTNSLLINSSSAQLLDSTLTNTTLEDQELSFNPETVNEGLRAQKFGGDDSDYTQENESTDQVGDFAALDGDRTDVNSDLRDASWPSMVDYSKVQDDDIISSSTENGSTFARRDGASTDIVSDLQEVQWNEPVQEPTYDGDIDESVALEPEVPVVPALKTIIKIVASDASGTPLKDGDGNYIGINETSEGENVYYVALAFEPNTTVFNDESKLDVQEGSIDFTFIDGTATSDTSGTNGENDYKSQESITNIELGTAVSVEALDDYVADNGETFNVSIENYKPVTNSKYEATTVDNSKVTTTITDNSNPNTPNNQTDDTVESDKEIVIIKLFAADKNGNVIKDGSGNYQLANEVYEGGDANYIAYAFESTETSFNDSTILDTQVGSVNVSFADNSSATGIENSSSSSTDGTQDYNKTSQNIKIGEAFGTETFIDSIAEGDENYTVTIDDNSYAPDVTNGGYESVELDANAVTTTIKDAKVFVKIEVVDGEANEGGNLTYKVSIVNGNGDPITVPADKDIKVNLTYEGNTSNVATDGTDYTKTEQVTITAGNSETTLTIPTIDDYYAEGDEGLKITIGNIDNTSGAFDDIYTHTTANDAPSDEITATGTITDNPANINKPTDESNTDDSITGSYDQDDTVYAIIEGPASVNEGSTTTDYTVKLVDKDGNEVKVTEATEVTVKYTNDTTEDGDTQYNNNDIITITIPAYSSSNTFTVETNDDPYKDDNEIYNLEISNVENTGEFENVAIGDKDGSNKDVTTTISDNTTETKIVLIAVDSSTTTIADITNEDGTLNIENTNNTTEGDKLYYMAVAVDSSGKPLDTQDGQVTLSISDGTAIGGTTATPLIDGSEDYNNSLDTTKVNIGTVFEVETNDDYLAENAGENFTVKISDPTDTSYESVTIDTSNDIVTSTIIDNPAQKSSNTKEISREEGGYESTDTVYVKITDDDSEIEGNTLTHTVTLVDKDDNPIIVPAGETITVTLGYSDYTTEDADFKDATKVTEVTITGGNSSVIVSNITIDDFVANENSDGSNESYTLSITDVAQSNDSFENVAIDSTNNSVTGEILDGVTIGVPDDANVDEDNFDVTDPNTKVEASGSLGIQKPNTDDDYTLTFDNTISAFKGDTSSGTSLSDLKSGGEDISYTVNGDTITATANGEIVFEIVLNKNSDLDSGTITKDSYTYTQYKNIDHPIKGTVGTDEGVDDNITFEFGFNITDQGQTSPTQTFKITVNDSLPESTDWDEIVNEDSSVQIVISPESFAGGYIEIKNKEGDDFTKLGSTISGDIVDSIDIYDPVDTGTVIGQLTTSGDGTVVFTPNGDYSNYAQKPWFEYAVSDFDGDQSGAKVSIDVKAVADAPTIEVADVTTTEDDGNTSEGTHKVDLGLKTPSLSTDQTDINNATGDNSERNGEITLTFTNGKDVEGAKIFSGGTEVATINSVDQELKVVIVTSSGSTDIDTDYHHSGTLPAKSGNVLYLTKDEYEALQIQHAEDNDTDIKIDIGITSYEVNDTNEPLDTATYGTQVEKDTTESMTVKITPVTDDFTLDWNGDVSSNSQVNSVSGDTVTFKDISENNSNSQAGTVVNNSLDLKVLLTATSGISSNNTGNDTGLDLDGSEKRSYTIKLTEKNGDDLPEFIYITIGGKEDVKAYNDGNDEYTVTFGDDENKVADPDFSMKFPDYWSGSVTGTITLKSQDEGADSTDTVGSEESDSVNFEVTVTPVANLATIQVAQSVGYEDQEIPLDIKVSSDDEDGSESFNVQISEIPTGSVISYDGNVVSQYPTGTVEISNFDNTKSLTILTKENEDSDFTLKVKSQTVDNTDSINWDDAPTKDIDVIVKNIADAPVGTDLNTNISVDEESQLNLKDIYTTPTNLKSSDDSEELTVKIDFKDTGITIDSGSPFYIQNGMYVVKASDIKDGNIKLKVPKDFSGSASFDLTYVTTEKAGEGDSKTWDTQTVNIFVNPIADDVTVADGSTINEDADGSANKVNLQATLSDADTHGVETIDSVKILASDIPIGYKLYSDASMTTELTTTNVSGTDYYVLAAEQADSVYAKNTTTHDADNVDSFDLTVVYTVTDTNVGTDTKEFTHTHTVNVQAVTDDPTLTLGTIDDSDANVSVSGTTVTVSAEDTTFKVPVTTTSSDTDGSEAVTKIVISGVPMGVEVVGGTYYGYSGSEHNGIWEILAPTDSTLDTDGALSDITFKVNQGANFEDRDITITTYTQDVDAEVESASQTIHIDKTYTSTGPGTGTPPLFDLSTKTTTIYEDNNDGTNDVIYNLGKSIDVTNSGGSASGNYAITLTGFPEGTMVEGYSYSYEEGEKTYYVVVGTGNAADVEAKLSTVIVTPPTDMNTGGDKDGKMTFSATISTFDGGTFAKGTGIDDYTQDIIPVTDAMTVAVSADNINEDGTSNISITLTNPNDGTKTELLNNSITIKVTETWADDADGGEENGTLTQSGTAYNIVDNNDGTYTITKTNGTDFKVDEEITGLQYTPAQNRDGSVNFEVSVKNKETGSDVTLDSKGTASIAVTPVVDAVLSTETVIANGTEDQMLSGIDLANPVKLEITTDALPDGSETLGNIILDEVPNGFTVWYNSGTELVMATNIGTTTGTAFDLTPNIDGDDNATRNKWLVPNTDGTMPEIYINAPENWSGTFDFDAIVSIKEENLSTYTSETVDVTGTISAVADGVTIDPTDTFGDAFSWVDLNLNANMVDVDGSETMSLEISGLNESAQFQLEDGSEVSATFADNKWTLEGVSYENINNIQFAHDKSVDTVNVNASTVDGSVVSTSESTGSFKLDIAEVSGTFKLDAGLSLDFSKLDDLSSAKNIDTIDLGIAGENKLENLTLDDILDMTDSNNEIKIDGDNADSVALTGGDWSKGASDGTYTEYTNNSDDTVKVKVEDTISSVTIA